MTAVAVHVLGGRRGQRGPDEKDESDEKDENDAGNARRLTAWCFRHEAMEAEARRRRPAGSFLRRRRPCQGVGEGAGATAGRRLGQSRAATPQESNSGLIHA